MHMASIAHRQQHATPLRTSSNCFPRHGRLLGLHAPREPYHSVVTRVATPKPASAEDTKQDINVIEGPSTDLSVIYGRLQRVRHHITAMIALPPS
jgi:hypothetical protein